MTTQNTNIDQPRKRARNFWKTYKRLTSYVMKDKGKLIALILFSFVAASSLGVILITVSAGIEVLYVSDDIVTVEGKAPTSELNELIEDYREWATDNENSIEKWTNWRPNLEDSVISTIHAMRADQSYSMRLIALMIITITLLGGIARYLQQYFAGLISAHVVQQLRSELYGSIMQQSHDFFESRKSGTIMARFSSDVMMVNVGLTSVFVILFREPIKVLVILAVAFSVSPKITLLILFFLLPLILLFMLMAKKLKRRVTSQLNRLASVTSILIETIKGITVVKSFRMEEHESSVMDKELISLRYQMTKIAKLDALVGPATELFLICGAAMLIMVGNKIMITEGIGFDGLIKLVLAMVMVVDPMRKVAKINNKIQVSAISGERVFTYLDAQPTVQEIASPVELPTICLLYTSDAADE